MASAELHQGGKQEQGFKEKAGWYTTALGAVALGLGLLGGSNSLAALGVAITVGGLVLGNA